MRIVAISTLRDLYKKYPNACEPIAAWIAAVSKARWSRPADAKAHYQNASILKNRRVVFNIKGNDYRLIVAIACKQQIVCIKFIGAHKQYDAVDAETVEVD